MRRVLFPLLLIAACSGSAITTNKTTDPTMTPENVTFTTEDGLILEGRVFGSGPNYVVLAHMRPAAMDSWSSFAEELASKGYSALTFNFRGYGASDGRGFRVDVDVIAAIDHALSLGADNVFVVGASMGGTGAIAAAAARPVASVVTLSAPARFEGVDAVAAAAKVSVPILLIAGENNPPYPKEAERIAAAAAGPTEIRIIPSSAHGTDLFSDMDEPTKDLIVSWLNA